MNTNLVTQKEYHFDIPELTNINTDELSDILDVGFDRVGFPGAGGQTFVVPGLDPNEPDSLRTISGVIVWSHPASALWFSKDPDGSEPDVRSYDGVTQIITAEALNKATRMELPEPLVNVKDCPYNQWGSAHLVGGSGAGKAVTDKRVLYIIRSGEVLPIILDLPAMSIRPFKDYRAKRIIVKGLSLAGVITRIGLEKVANKAGQPYSRATFALEAVLAQEQASMMFEYQEMLRQRALRLGVPRAPAHIAPPPVTVQSPAQAAATFVPPPPVQWEGPVAPPVEPIPDDDLPF